MLEKHWSKWIFLSLGCTLEFTVVVQLLSRVWLFCNLDCSQALCPWNFPGKNTGVSCYFLLQGIFPTQRLNLSLLHWQVDFLPLSCPRSPRVHCMHVCSVMSDYLWHHGLQPTRLLCPWNFPGKNTGLGCHFLPQGIFPIQGSNPSLLCLLHWQVDSLLLAPPGKPGIHWGF